MLQIFQFTQVETMKKGSGLVLPCRIVSFPKLADKSMAAWLFEAMSKFETRKCLRPCCMPTAGLKLENKGFSRASLEGLCVEAIFSSLFQPQFRAHKPGRKIAEAASGHCHNSHTWPFGQEEVQLREFVSTYIIHVKPLSGPETWPRTSLMSILSLAPPPSPTARLLWHLQRALHQAACHATACA